jgi:2-oxoglutarate dehydrogenase E2 component (dihydrolipoamide succinyltransferase)
MSTDYQLPQLPFGNPEGTILYWLKQPGDRVSSGDPLLVVANDCVEIVFPALHEGVLQAVLAVEGETVAVGAVIARLATERMAMDEGGTGKNRESAIQNRDSAARPIEAHRHATPLARRIAANSQIDITALIGSGPNGRILKSDVLAALESLGTSVARSPLPVAADHEQRTTNYELPNEDVTSILPPSSMRRAIAAHMVRSRATSPHALTAMEVDMGQVAAARARAHDGFARRGIDLTYTACIALAAVEALLHHPLLNSYWSDAGIVLRRRIHLGIAVALPDGLITPIIREAQDLNLRGMARAVADAARRARGGALRPGEASGGTFTLTNPGAGSLWFGTPIIAQPQSAILGVGAVRKRPLVVDEGGIDRIVVRPVALLTLAYDARILDQCCADAFLRDVKQMLEHFNLRTA